MIRSASVTTYSHAAIITPQEIFFVTTLGLASKRVSPFSAKRNSLGNRPFSPLFHWI